MEFLIFLALGIVLGLLVPLAVSRVNPEGWWRRLWLALAGLCVAGGFALGLADNGSQLLALAAMPVLTIIWWPAASGLLENYTLHRHWWRGVRRRP